MVKGKLALVLLLLHKAIGEGPVFLQPLSNVITAPTEESVVLTCKVKASNLFWFINETWYTEKTMLSLQLKGFSLSTFSYEADGSTSQNVTVNVSKNNVNNTILWCRAFNNGNDTISSNATIYIAGAPLSPSPVFSVVNNVTVQLTWDSPFTWSAFPILNYTVQIINLTNAEMLAFEVIPTSKLSYNITNTAPPTCSNLEFIVSATNKVGTANGRTNGRFPSAPGDFEHAVKTSLLLTSRNTIHLNISFIVPFLCEDSDATYSIVIYSGERDVTVGPHLVSWKMRGTRLSIVITEGLKLNTLYTATIRVETLVGLSHSTVRFSTSCIATDSCPSITVISCTVAGALVTLCCLVIFVCVILRYRRCRKTNGEQPTDLPNTSSIYEEIAVSTVVKTRHAEREEGYVSIATSRRITRTDLPPSEQQTSCELGTPVNEDTYTVMNSAGTVTFQLRDSSYSEPAVSSIL